MNWLAYAGLGLTVLIVGASWFIQGKILRCPDERREKLAGRLLVAGIVIMAVGLGYIIGAVLVALP